VRVRRLHAGARVLVRQAQVERQSRRLTDDETVRLAVASLLEVIEKGAKNLEVEPMPGGQAMRLMAKEDLPRVSDSLNKKSLSARSGRSDEGPTGQAEFARAEG
jgi:hypothetical protein